MYPTNLTYVLLTNLSFLNWSDLHSFIYLPMNKLVFVQVVESNQYLFDYTSYITFTVSLDFGKIV
jgi:hypothetical protein